MSAATSTPPGAAVETDLWVVPLDPGTGGPAGRADALSDDEQARAARFVFAQDRARWITARQALREILSGYVGRAPRELRFAYGPHGKPFLDGPEPVVSFNLSHAEGLAAVAVAEGTPVGVDVERLRELRDAASLAERFFAAIERDAVLAPRVGLVERFFACWTRKEAVIKALGAGLGFGIDRFAVSVSPDEPARLLWSAAAELPVESWALAHVDAAPGFVGAVAVRGPGVRVTIRAWGEGV